MNSKDLKYYTLIGIDSLDRFVVYFNKHNAVTEDMSARYMYGWLTIDECSDECRVPATRHVRGISMILTSHAKHVLTTTDSREELIEVVKHYYIRDELGK